MSERPTTEHNGYKIVFEEWEDKWVCHSLKLGHASLKKLKERINAWDLQTRKVPNIEAILIGWQKDTAIVNISSIADAKSVWVKRGKGDSRERSKESVSNLVFRNTENNSILDKAKGMFNQAKEIERSAKDLMESIPRITVDELREIAGQALDEESVA